MSNKRKKRWDRKKFKKHMADGLDNRRRFPLHDDSPEIDKYGITKLEAPDLEPVEIIKEVPAMHTGLPGGEHEGEKVEVGTAYIHSDSSVGLRYHDDAPLWAMEEIQAFADKVGYSLETGAPRDGSA